MTFLEDLLIAFEAELKSTGLPGGALTLSPGVRLYVSHSRAQARGFPHREDPTLDFRPCRSLEISAALL